MTKINNITMTSGTTIARIIVSSSLSSSPSESVVSVCTTVGSTIKHHMKLLVLILSTDNSPVVSVATSLDVTEIGFVLVAETSSVELGVGAVLSEVA